jgi:UDP-N-acetylglucosamine acyltransferase
MGHQFSPLASIAPQAEIESDVVIGPFCFIGPNVRVGRSCRLENHVTLTGRTTLGESNHLFPGVVIGEVAVNSIDVQASIVIGNHNIIREGTTIAPGVTPTRIGSHNVLMAQCHIGKDCVLGDYVTIANAAVLESRVLVDDRATFSGRVVIREGVAVGSCSFTSISSHVICDVPPFVIVEGNPARPRSLNLIGLARNGFTSEAIRALSLAYRLFFRSEINICEARIILQSAIQNEPRLELFLRFIDSHPK